MAVNMSSDTKFLLDYEFNFVTVIQPQLANGEILDFYPQDRYSKRKISQLNKYGHGAFCKFSIDPKWRGISGVYALFNCNNLIYIGKCVDFAKRFNTGYGNISPRNCYIGGQLTNCRINKIVRAFIKQGDPVSLFFFATSNYNKIEEELITHYKPEHNHTLKLTETI